MELGCETCRREPRDDAFEYYCRPSYPKKKRETTTRYVFEVVRGEKGVLWHHFFLASFRRRQAKNRHSKSAKKGTKRREYIYLTSHHLCVSTPTKAVVVVVFFFCGERERERERESERRRRVGGVLGVDALALVEKDDGTDSDTTTL